jgi:hypothetical protein
MSEFILINAMQNTEYSGIPPGTLFVLVSTGEVRRGIVGCLHHAAALPPAEAALRHRTLVRGIILGPYVLDIFGTQRPVADFMTDLSKLLLMFFAGLDLAFSRRVRDARTPDLQSAAAATKNGRASIHQPENNVRK